MGEHIVLIFGLIIFLLEASLELIDRMKAGIEILRDKGLRQFTKSFMTYIKTVTISSSKFKLRGLFKPYNSSINGVKILDVECLNSFIRGKIENGSYEESEYKLIEKHLDSKSNIIELGGGIGYIACFSNRNLDNPANHVVLEANPQLIEIIEKHKVLNSASFRIDNYAYHNGAEKVSLSLSNEFWKSSTKINEKHKAKVDTINLEKIVKREDFDDFILIADIEGGEIELHQELDFIKKYCQQMIVETHPSLYEDDQEFNDKILSQLRSNGFELIDKERNVLVIEKV